VKVKIRYKSEESEAIIYKSKDKTYKIIFKKPQKSITSGQSAVFYKKDELLGGGIIDKIE
jgi:tRNA-specific 2-thiouridylase